MASILLIPGNNKRHLAQLTAWLGPTPFHLCTAHTPKDALLHLSAGTVDVVLYVPEHPEITDDRIIYALHACSPKVPIILLLNNAQRAQSSAQEELKITELIVCPLQRDSLIFQVQRQIQLQALSRENRYLHEEIAFQRLSDRE